MGIVFLVAGNTIGLRIRERLSDVAGITFFLAVLAEQRESSQIVIKKYRILPVDFRVTNFTLGADTSLVRIVV